MTDAVVVDPSVATKWVLGEDFSDLAESLYLRWLENRYAVVSAPLFPAEVAGAIYQRVRRRELTTAQAITALTLFLSFPVELASPPGLYEKALTIAQELSLSLFHDAIYIALAEMLDAELWTADSRLVKKVHASMPFVRWIGEYDAHKTTANDWSNVRPFPSSPDEG